MVVRAVPESDQYWVDAAPFRAQLRYLMANSSLTAEEVAAAVGISARLAELLLNGRNERPLRRVSYENGRRLLEMSIEDLRPRRPGAGAAA